MAQAEQTDELKGKDLEDFLGREAATMQFEDVP